MITVKNFKDIDAINALKSYPRTFISEDYSNYPHVFGCEYYYPEDCSGTEKHLFINWGWFQDSVISRAGITTIVNAYNSLGGTIKWKSSYDCKLEDKDILALLIGGTHPNISNSFDFERRQLGCHTNVGNHLWMWNRKVLNDVIPYDKPINGNMTIQQELIQLYNTMTGRDLIIIE